MNFHKENMQGTLGVTLQLYIKTSGTCPASPGRFLKKIFINRIKKMEKIFSISRKTTLNYSIQVSKI